jgi:hypothetical protein
MVARPFVQARLIYRGHLRNRRLVQKPAGGIVRLQERFDPLPQLGICAAFALQHLCAGGGVARFDSKEEDGLDAIRVGWHTVSSNRLFGSPCKRGLSS